MVGGGVAVDVGSNTSVRVGRGEGEAVGRSGSWTWGVLTIVARGTVSVSWCVGVSVGCRRRGFGVGLVERGDVGDGVIVGEVGEGDVLVDKGDVATTRGATVTVPVGVRMFPARIWLLTDETAVTSTTRLTTARAAPTR